MSDSIFATRIAQVASFGEVSLAGSRSIEPVHVRLRAVREATGETQVVFLPRLNREAAARGVREYSQSTLSKLESGTQAATFDDIAVFAGVDPKGRGKLWLAWGEAEDATVKRSARARDIPVEAMERVSSKKDAPGRRATGR
jgi:transcriptional regulator with XRE-family HTH domain